MVKTRRPLGSVPDPTARDCLLNGLIVLYDDVASLVLLGFAAALVGAVGPVFWFGGDTARAGAVLFYVFIGFPLEVGFAFVCLRAVRSGSARYEHLFAVISNYREIALAGILLSLLIIGASGFFMLPGIWVYLRTRFVPYLLMEDELDAATAIRESWKLTKGATGRILAISLVGWLSYLVGGMLLLLGISPALAWWNCSMASLYHSRVTAPEAWQVEDSEVLEAQRDEGMQDDAPEGA
jgi:hypothetical protein